MKSEAQAKEGRLINSDIIVGLFCIGLAAVAYFDTRHLSKLGGIFVDYTVVAMAVLGLMVFIKGFIKPERIRFFESVMERNNVAIGVSILALYLIFLPLAGFLASSYAFYFCFNLYLADERFTTRNILVSALLTVVVVTVFFVIFREFLEVPLPVGAWFGGD